MRTLANDEDPDEIPHTSFSVFLFTMSLISLWHGDTIHRILYRPMHWFYPGYMGTASFTVNIMEERMGVEGKCDENSKKEE